MTIIYASGEQVLIDDEDAARVERYVWHTKTGGYIRTMIDGKHTLLHRFIMKAKPSDPMIDHRDEDPLNNRKSNLRFVTNEFNVSRSSKHRGYYLDTRRGLWAAKIVFEGKLIWLGYHEREQDAHRIYKQTRKQLIGE